MPSVGLIFSTTRSCLLAFLVALAPLAALAEEAGVAVPATENQAIRKGAELERDRHWSDAIDFYEKCLKSWSDNGQLQYGLRRAKVQFSIERRYSEKSFLTDMLGQQRPEATGHLEDVLAKVRKHYVDPISATSFVAHGTESLYHALANDRFLEHHSTGRSPEAYTRLRKILRDQYWNRSCPGPDSAIALVNEVADLTFTEAGIPPVATIFEYVFGGCNSLDDYSNYLTPGRLGDLYSNIEGEFVGIGIEMKSEAGKGLLLVNVLPESPADEAGALPGEFITSIDGRDCRKLTTEEAAQLLQGAPNSRVQLELSGGDTPPRRAFLTRRAVKVKSIPVVELIDSANGVGYIRMTGFQKNSADELDQALSRLEREGMRALIWDLRGNPGGLLTAAVEVLDRFIDDGVLVSTKGRMVDQNWTYSATRIGTRDLPLVVLVDGDSASASEIVAGAVRDHRRGTLVGRKTYGKWSVQSILPGRGETGLRLTTAKFYSPSGNTYGKIGVEPDVLVETTTEQQLAAYRGKKRGQIDRDQDITKGLEVLRKQLAKR